MINAAADFSHKLLLLCYDPRFVTSLKFITSSIALVDRVVDERREMKPCIGLCVLYDVHTYGWLSS